MYKKIFLIILTCLLSLSLVGCSSKDNTVQEKVGSKWLNADVIGNVTRETKVSLKDDFYAASNFDWLINASIKEGQSVEGGLDKYSDQLEDQLKSLINNDEINSHEEEVVSTLYNKAVDWETRNRYGVEPIRTYLDAIANISTIDELTNYFLSDYAIGFTLSNFVSDYSIIDSNKRALCIDEPITIYSDNNDYNELSSYGQYQENYSKTVVTYLLVRLGYSESEAASIYETCIEFEREIAPSNYSQSEKSDSNFDNSISRNEMSLDEIEEIAGAYPIVTILKGLGYDVCEVYGVYNPRSLKEIASIYNEEHLEKIKDYLLVHTLLDNVDRLDYDAYDFALTTSNNLQGISGKISDEKYGLNVVQTYAFDALDALYTEEYCSKDIKEDVESMIDTYVEYYEKMLENVDWLSKETRNKAIEKLQAINGHASYPDKHVDYSALDLTDLKDDGSYLEVCAKIKAFKKQIKIDRLKTDKTAEYWDDEQQFGASTINAFYDYACNDIFICNGLLTAINYDINWSKEEKLATLGMIIGHELSHAFDPSGAKFDKDGNVNLWWNDEELQEFENRAQKLSDYMNLIKPANNGSDAYVNGDKVRNETVADITGFKATLLIAKNIDNFDYDKFFRAYSYMWVKVELPSYEVYLMSVDVHALAYLRVNVILQQFDEFYDTYNIKEGDGMYLAKEKRLSVW